MTKLITIKQILALNPCEEYNTAAKIIAETDSNWPKTMREISELDIPAKDRFWVLIELLDPTTSGHVACDIAESVLHLYESQCPGDYRVRDYIGAKRMWLDGLVDDEALSATRTAVRAAASAASTAPTAPYNTSGDYRTATSAAHSAACATRAAFADAYFTAYYAARAASIAAYYAAPAGAWGKNLEILKKYL